MDLRAMTARCFARSRPRRPTGSSIHGRATARPSRFLRGILTVGAWLCALGVAATAAPQTFLAGPYADDAANENSAKAADFIPTLSPNGDNVEDSAFVVFTTDTLSGSYRVLVDTRGPGGVGGPDGTFNEKDDWLWKGSVQSIPVSPAGATSVTIAAEWNGAPQWNASTKVPDGVYTAQVAFDNFDNTVIDGGATTATVRVRVDTVRPTVSLRASDFSPNADGALDTTTLSYGSDETPAKVAFSFSGPATGSPRLTLPTPLTSAASIVWDGKDAGGTLLRDGAYTLKIAVTDAGGNAGEATASVLVDTEAPLLTALQPAEGANVNGTVGEIVATVNPGTGSPLDLDATGTGVVVTTPAGATRTITLPTVRDPQSNTLRFAVSPPIAATSENGSYSLALTVFDRAGNALRRTTAFRLDTVAPAISRVASSQGVVLTSGAAPILPSSETITVELVEEGSGPNLGGATLRLRSPSGVDLPLAIQTQRTPALLRATYANLVENGTHTLTVSGVADLAGNVLAASSFVFRHEGAVIALPAVASTTPAHGAYVNTAIRSVSATFRAGSGEGVDLAASTLQLSGPRGPVPGTRVLLSEQTAVRLDLDFPLAVDGTDDGAYTVLVVPVDAAGNAGQQRSLTFTYDTTSPKLVALAPLNLLAATTYIAQPFESLTATAQDAGSGVDLARTELTLGRADGTSIPTTLQKEDPGTVILRLAQPFGRNGAQDGEYIVAATVADKAGNRTQRSVRFLYDTQPPTLTKQEPASGGTFTTETLKVTLTASDAASGLDFAATTVQLRAPDGSAVPATVKHDGTTTLTLETGLLAQTGVYALDATLVDRAGNASVPIRSRLEYARPAPTVVSITPAHKAYVRAVDTLSATLSGASGGSRLELVAPDGRTVVGRTTFAAGTLTFEPETPLQLDGRDDGVYSVRVTPVNAVGVAGDTRTFTFTYDTRAPDIAAAAPLDEGASESYTRTTITRVTATLQDGLSGADTSASTIRVVGKEGAEVGGSQGTDGKTAIWWDLSPGLSPGAGRDGVYTVVVAAKDRAGNVADKSYSLVYDTTAPSVESTVPAAGATVANPLSEVRVTLSDSTSGVQPDAVKVDLSGPTGPMTTTRRVDGGTVVLTFAPLRTNGADDGIYRINITAADRAGNSASVAVPFYYVTRGLRVVSTTPAGGTATNDLRTVQAALEERSGIGLDIERSSLRLLGPSGQAVPGRLARAGSTLTFSLDTPFPTDGSADGRYTVEVTAVDAVGNALTEKAEVLLDTAPAAVVATSPAANAVLTVAATSASVQLKDGGIGPDLVGTQITLRGPSGAPIAADRRAAGDTIALSFAALTEPGNYALEVFPRDRAGNVAASPVRVPFTVSLPPPAVAKVAVPGTGSFTSVLTEVIVVFEDPSGVGLNLAEGGTSIRVTGPQGPVPGSFTAAASSGASLDPLKLNALERLLGGGGVAFDPLELGQLERALATSAAAASRELKWRPLLPLATDGTADGNYTISVTPVDLAGRAGATVERTVTYDTRIPRVTSVSPINANLAVNYIGQAIAQVEATLQDDGPAGLDITAQTIFLLRPDGVPVVGAPANDGVSRVIWQLNRPLPTDGSADAQYTLTVTARDRAGNAVRRDYPIMYDTQAPTLLDSSVKQGETIPATTQSVSILLEDKGFGGVDFGATTVVLVAPDGSTVPGSLHDNGANKFEFRFDRDLTQDGTHTLRMTLADRAGNRRNVELSFFHLANIPTVLSTVPKTFPVEEAYAPSGLREVTARLQQTNQGGISLAPIHAEIRLVDGNGNTVPGTQASSGTDTLVYRLAKPLADDGSDDGTYRILVVPANAAGKKGAQKTFTFFYDSRPPKVDITSIQTLFPSGGGNSIAGFAAVVSDPQPSSGVDWENVDDTWMTLSGPGQRAREASVSGDAQSASLALVLIQPLASDGTDDGEYTLLIAPHDKAGNVAEGVGLRFTVDTKAPVVDVASLTLNDKPIVTDTNRLDYPTSINSEAGVTIRVRITDDGVGADLARSSITLESPQAQPITGTLRQNGVDQLEFTSGALTQEGLYRVTIMAQGLDVHGLGIQPRSTVGARFLFEKTPPTVTITNAGGSGVFKSTPAHISGRAQDAVGGTGQNTVPASGVALVEIGATTAAGEEPRWEPATDESTEQQKPWSQWSAKFLPSRSGKYRVSVRVTDRAGNVNVVDVGTLEFTTALAFKGPVYTWPSPLSLSRGDSAHFSFETNQADPADLTLRIYDVSGATVFEKEFTASRDRAVNSQTITWNLTNDRGNTVAAGIYAYRLEMDDGRSTTRTMGRLLVVR
jgi:flagellar hook assembly protein FlgD